MSRATILLCDDDPAVLRGVAGILEDEGYRTLRAGSAAEARAILGASPPDALLLDLNLPGESGLQLLESLPRPLRLPVVVLSGGATPGEAVRALQLGATDFVEKPPSAERLLTALANALALRAAQAGQARLEGERAQLLAERERLLEELAQPGTLLGESAAMAELRKLIARVGKSDALVLIQGETGTGKERVSRALHLASGRTGRFVAVNCAAIPAALIESELFGAERGAFTGANARRLGRFEQAQRGTLLLDEVGELPLDVQAKLLRVLEQREVERLGGGAPVPLDVRVLAATHRDLGAQVREGRFRQDLYYRLHVFPLLVPPLRERPDDVLPLVRTFVAELAGPAVALSIAPEGEAALRAHRWPGNVRELRNFVERLVLLGERGAPVSIDASSARLLGEPRSEAGGGAVPSSDPGAAGATASAGVDLSGIGDSSLREILEAQERAVLQAALARSDGNVAAAARLLKVDRGNLWRRLKALGLEAGSE